MAILVGESKDPNQNIGPKCGVFTNNSHLSVTILGIFFYRGDDFRNQIKNQRLINYDGISSYVKYTHLYSKNI